MNRLALKSNLSGSFLFKYILEIFKEFNLSKIKRETKVAKTII